MIDYDNVFYDDDITDLNEELLLEMTNLEHTKTGLPYDIWLDSEGVDRKNTHHGPRIKVKVNGQLIPFEISDNPDIPESVKKTGLTDFPHKNKIREYVIAYKKVLLAHYFKQLRDDEVLELLKTLKYAPEAELKLSEWTDARPNLRIEFRWDPEEMLYIIELKDDNNSIKTLYAMDTTYLFIEMGKLKEQYGVEKIIDLDRQI